MRRTSASRRATSGPVSRSGGAGVEGDASAVLADMTTSWGTFVDSRREPGGAARVEGPDVRPDREDDDLEEAKCRRRRPAGTMQRRTCWCQVRVGAPGTGTVW